MLNIFWSRLKMFSQFFLNNTLIINIILYIVTMMKCNYLFHQAVVQLYFLVFIRLYT